MVSSDQPAINSGCKTHSKPCYAKAKMSRSFLFTFPHGIRGIRGRYAGLCRYFCQLNHRGRPGRTVLSIFTRTGYLLSVFGHRGYCLSGIKSHQFDDSHNWARRAPPTRTRCRANAAPASAMPARHSPGTGPPSYAPLDLPFSCCVHTSH